MGVRTIGDRAFQECVDLERVDLPASLIHLGVVPFSSCEKLQQIHLATGNLSFKVVEGLLETRDGKRLIRAENTVTEVVLPDGMTNVCAQAFYSCKQLTSVVIPSSVVEIGEMAFWGCA